MLKRLLFAAGIGYLFRRFAGGRRMPRSTGARW